MAAHPHLFVRRKGRAIAFQGITPIIPTVRVPRINRRQHIEMLDAAVDLAAERNEAIPPLLQNPKVFVGYDAEFV